MPVSKISWKIICMNSSARGKSNWRQRRTIFLPTGLRHTRDISTPTSPSRARQPPPAFAQVMSSNRVTAPSPSPDFSRLLPRIWRGVLATSRHRGRAPENRMAPLHDKTLAVYYVVDVQYLLEDILEKQSSVRLGNQCGFGGSNNRWRRGIRTRSEIGKRDYWGQAMAGRNGHRPRWHRVERGI